ncbi:MAG: DUF2851 family protein [Bacteroidetes bacterium]|nr:DUF2851 family protein [Bacteroidota bacterium]
MTQLVYNEFNEIELQHGVHKLLGEPSRIWITESGKQLQSLSPGKLNVHEGPDFLDVAILLDGEIMIGNAEFHRKSSDWIVHRHSQNTKYHSILLHIVFIHDSNGTFAKETLVVPTDEVVGIAKAFLTNQDVSENREVIEDLQDYALLRLLRKTSEFQIEVNKYGLQKAFFGSIRDFLTNFKLKRRRPIYSNDRLHYFEEHIRQSPIVHLFDDIVSGNSEKNISLVMKELLKNKLVNEGSALRREIILNCFLPAIITSSNSTLRIEIFAWYWSVKSIGKYGILKREFPNVPQSYLWQQQGLLEFIRTNGLKGMMCSEAIKGYGFAETLHFYRTASQPLNREVNILSKDFETFDTEDFDEMD